MRTPTLDTGAKSLSYHQDEEEKDEEEEGEEEDSLIGHILQVLV